MSGKWIDAQRGIWSARLDALDAALETEDVMAGKSDGGDREYGSPILVCVTRRYSASAERVFDAWLDPAMIGKFMFGSHLRDETVLHLNVDGARRRCVFVSGTQAEHGHRSCRDVQRTRPAAAFGFQLVRRRSGQRSVNRRR